MSNGTIGIKSLVHISALVTQIVAHDYIGGVDSDGYVDNDDDDDTECDGDDEQRLQQPGTSGGGMSSMDRREKVRTTYL